MNLQRKPQIYIGIDPDVDKSGVGVIDIKPTGEIETHYTSLPLPRLIDNIAFIAESGEAQQRPVKIYIEAGWLNSGNWHLNPRDTKQVAAAKGRQAGRNHQLGLDICALLAARGFPAKEVMPLTKCWKGKDRKITHAELDTIIRWVNGTGMEKARSNQEERDALLLAWYHADLPIKC